MNAKINEVITGEYDHKGAAILYADTDSVAGNSVVRTSVGEMTIETLFDQCRIKWADGAKEYATDERFEVVGYDPSSDRALMQTIKYVYRHKVTKARYRIASSNGLSVEVTGDHSIMIERDGNLLDVKPKELSGCETLLVFDGNLSRTTVSEVTELDIFDDEYVYDIGVSSEHPYFFANDILVHNSSYFSAYEVLKKNPDYADFEWSRENVISLYDAISEEANQSFPEFMARAFNTSEKRGAIIKAGRELVGSKALFIKKKKYAILMFDKEGKRLDADGKPGKMKIMGLETRRSDTPVYAQKFLEGLLLDLLTDKTEQEMFEKIKAFRKWFAQLPGWEKGTPKKVNGLTVKVDAVKKAAGQSIEIAFKKGKKGKVDMPGHVRASINWNDMCSINKDLYSTRITDGAKVIVCKLKPNIYKIDSIAYPIDQHVLPDWFKTLPFDHAEMELTIIDNKLNNLFGVLGWDFEKTKERDDDDIFVF